MLARIDTGRGQEQLYLDQSPQLLERLAEDARIESITASNRIEGINVDPERAQKLANKKLKFRNRSEKEFAGYRDALDELTQGHNSEPLSVPFILHLHRQIFQYSGGRGGHLKSDPNRIVSRQSGTAEVIFEPASPEETPVLLEELIDRYNQAKEDGSAHHLILLGAFVVDFLAIHPVADGNGRLARLITTRELLANGYGVSRYVSLEQRILNTKNAYYSSLYESQKGWHDGEQQIWPFVTYLLSVLSDAYGAFEERRASETSSVLGSKQDRIRTHVLQRGSSDFSRNEVERAFPDISVATIRLVLNQLRSEGAIKSDGNGRSARWHVVEEPGD